MLTESYPLPSVNRSEPKNLVYPRSDEFVA